MLKLFKYEMRKTLMPKLIMLGLFVVLQGFLLYTISQGKEESTLMIAVLTVFASFLAVFFIGIYSIVTLHHDINSKQGYMLFMTPNSTYKILGAKVLECTVSVLLAGAVFFGICLLDLKLIMNKFPKLSDIQELFEMMKQVANLEINIDMAKALTFVFETVIEWVETVVLAFFADVLATSLLKGKKLGGLLAFLLFIVLSTLAGKLVSLVSGAVPSQTLLLKSIAVLAVCIAGWIATARLMEKKLSV
ncbi:MAG: hypothetical protein Q4G19_06970 [Clostridia bacterium]|nr:hypothetical protein [Clostridia bacterium]